MRWAAGADVQALWLAAGRLLLDRHAWVRRAAGRLLGSAFADAKIGVLPALPSNQALPLASHRSWGAQAVPRECPCMQAEACRAHHDRPVNVMVLWWLFVTLLDTQMLWCGLCGGVGRNHARIIARLSSAGEPMLAADGALAGRLALDSFRQLAAVGCDEGTARQVTPGVKTQTR